MLVGWVSEYVITYPVPGLQQEVGRSILPVIYTLWLAPKALKPVITQDSVPLADCMEQATSPE